ncbi:hypothetical protein PSTT_05555 [Puccinia striiformis]|uniref:Uncharacterized protein n=1 Tax=Puccinia striiformis TaxID=27350 RepID=A0A2S4VNJ7_9BASI|nr:hypothetical protein PSTT_05555 [Puccinia striiformis]
MDKYQVELKNCIDIFLSHLIRSTAQWINKPKFHMLLHLPDSILCFGPAFLYSTENIESFNSVRRKSAVHSNKQGPGKDIATTFHNYKALRFILCGGVVYDLETGLTSKFLPELISIFVNNPAMERSFGYNDAINNSSKAYPFIKRVPVPELEKINPPLSLQRKFVDFNKFGNSS